MNVDLLVLGGMKGMEYYKGTHNPLLHNTTFEKELTSGN